MSASTVSRSIQGESGPKARHSIAPRPFAGASARVRSRSAWYALLLLAVLAFASPSFGQVTVDGDLTDIIAVAQGSVADPINEICPNGKSGFDLAAVYVFYDEATDQLFVGLDLMDVPPGMGMGGPGVPGDADGNNDPDFPATNPTCVAKPFLDEDGVGPNEEYTLLIDTNANGRLDEAVDVRVRYQGNRLEIVPGNSNVPIPGASGIIVLGTAGSPTPSRGIPDNEENRNTTDIEIRVDNFRNLDPVPVCFRLVARAGSLVDGLPEDMTPAIAINLSRVDINIVKDVRNVTASGLFADVIGALRGDTVRFRMMVENKGNVFLDPTTVIDQLPAGLTFVPGSCTGATCMAMQQPDGTTLITFTNLNGSSRLEAGQTVTITFDATVNLDATGCFLNRARANGTGPMDCGSQPTSALDDAQVCVPEIDCVKTVSLNGTTFSSSVNACRGQTVFFKVVVTNPSSVVDLSSVTLRDVLPAGFTSISTSDPNCMVSGQTVTCNLGSLAAGASRTVEYRAVIANTASGPLDNVAHVEGSFAGRTVTDDCPARVNVFLPCVDVVCLTTPPPVVDPNSQVVLQYRVTNCGDVRFDDVAFTCTPDPNNPGLTVVQCPPNTGPLDPGASRIVNVTVRASATLCGQQCLNLTATADPTGLDPFCNVSDTDRCCVIVRPQIDVMKAVQFVCFLDPNDPNRIELQPPTPAAQVNAPPCGLVRFTIGVQNLCPNEGLVNVRVTDCLPADLLFRDNVMPPTPLGMAGEGPDCTGTGSTTPLVFRIPDLPPGGSYTFTFDAIVRMAAPPGIKTDFARARGTGQSSGVSTNIPQATANVNVQTVSARLDESGVNPGSICVTSQTRQQATFTYTFVNTGTWPLDPVIVGAAQLDPGLELVSQSPPPGTNVGPVNPGASVVITVVVRGVAGAFPVRRCVCLPVSAQPDCYDPRDTENCQIPLTREQCVNVFTPCIRVECLTTPPPLVDPNTPVTFQYRITNCGDVAFDSVAFACAVDPGLVLVQCPANLGTLNPGATATVSMQVRTTSACGRLCATLTATGDPAGLAPSCNVTASAQCCLDVKPAIAVTKQVQFVCFLDPNNPSQTELRPPAPAAQVDAPPCGLVRWTIRVQNLCTNEGLRNVRLTDCLPNDLLFRDNVIPATPLGMASEGPDCVGTGSTTPFVFRIPDLVPSGSYTFTFDAIVRMAATAGLKTNFARVRGTGQTSGIDTPVAEATARVNVQTASARLDASGVNPANICPPQTSTFTYTFVNTGTWPLDPVIIGAAQLDGCLEPVSQNPPPGTNVGPVPPGGTVTITVVVRAVAGPCPINRCVRLPVSAQPDCYDPRDTENCQIPLTREQCVNVFTPCIRVECLTTPPPLVDPNTPVTFQYRVTNCGDVAFDSVAFSCAVDAGLVLVQCPANLGTLNPGASATVNMQVRTTSACGRFCARLTATGDPAGLAPSCNVTATGECCLNVTPQIAVTKQVQFVCFLDPNDPNRIELQPPAPTGEVSAPQCGLVRWTIRVQNLCPNEGLRTVRVTDCLPNDLIFRDNVMPPTPIGMPSEGPDCTGTGSTTPIVFRIPDLAPSGSYTFSFDAIVRRNATAGLKTNFARARGVGAVSGATTNTAQDTARVDVRTINVSFTGTATNPGIICPGQQTTFTYTITNNGQWPLDPVVISRCTASPGLTILSQNPPEGTNIGPLAAGASVVVTVVARAEAGPFDASRCVDCSIFAQPDCFDPRDPTENCRLDRNASRCVTVNGPRIDVECLTPETQADLGTERTFQFRVRNTGDVAFDLVSYACASDPGLTVLTCPPPSGPLAPGGMVTVDVMTRIERNGSGGRICVRLTATGDPTGLPPECNVTDDAVCCVLAGNIPTLTELGALALALGLLVLLIRQRR